jgi:hypothetical protein
MHNDARMHMHIDCISFLCMSLFACQLKFNYTLIPDWVNKLCSSDMKDSLD